jgi:hypothetical protein
MSTLSEDGFTISSSTTNQDYNNNDDDDNNNINTVILLKLNKDGTFKQCNEGYQEGRWISGRWRLSHDDESLDTTTSHSVTTSNLKLILAMNRQYYGPQYDIVLDGRYVSDDQNTTINATTTSNENKTRVHGTVRKGKFLHPRSHPSFFDRPMLANQETIGPFVMEQSLAIQTILGDNYEDDEDNEDSDDGPPSLSLISSTVIQASDFYDKTFMMTIEPLEQRRKSPDQKQQSILDDRPVDIRTMKVQFFRNNTFSALGVNKILRGRFQVERNIDYNNNNNDNNDDDDDDDESTSYRLSMQVSIFGAGRSAPGSVFSEGIGLTHEDERAYIGNIQRQRRQHFLKAKGQRRLYVHGTAFFGTDLGSDARPEPVGEFYLTEDSTSNRKLVGDTDDLVTSVDEDDDPPYTDGVFE